MKKGFLTRPPVKITIVSILTIIISILVSLLGTWDKNQANFVMKLICFFACVVLYIGLMIFYTTDEVNHRRLLEVYKGRIDTFEDLVISIISICETNATDINKSIHHINEAKTIDLNIWSFDKSCKEICEHVFNNVCKLGNSKRYGVAYVKLLESDTNQDRVQMIAYANQNRHKPSVFNVKRQFKDINPENAFHDLCLFREAKSDNDIRFSQEEVDAVFAHTSKGNKNKGKYHFYIGIPVFCDNRKMIGLLEVIGFDDTKLGCITREEAEEITNKYLVPYANVFLLLHKMEKALLAGTSP